MEVLANDQQLKSLANTYAYFYPQSLYSIIIATSNTSEGSLLRTYLSQQKHRIEIIHTNVFILKRDPSPRLHSYKDNRMELLVWRW